MIEYEYTIYTRCLIEKNPSWDCMLSSFGSSHEALTWLMSCYQANADFWNDIEVKIVREIKK